MCHSDLPKAPGQSGHKGRRARTSASCNSLISSARVSFTWRGAAGVPGQVVQAMPWGLLRYVWMGRQTWLQLWGSCGGLQRVGAPQLSCLCTSWDNVRTVRGCVGNCTLWPVFMLGLRVLLGGCNKPEETQPCCDLCTGHQKCRGKQTPGSRRPEMNCRARKAPGPLPTENSVFPGIKPSSAPLLACPCALQRDVVRGGSIPAAAKFKI